MKVIDRDCVARTRAIILQTQLRLPMSCLSCDWPEDLVVVAKLPPKGPQTVDCQSPLAVPSPDVGAARIVHGNAVMII